MDYQYELITTDEQIPIKILIHTTDERQFIPRHWHESIEISYVLSGQIDEIYVDGVTYTSKQGDIVVINSNAIHSFSVDQGENRKAMTLFLPYDFLKQIAPHIEPIIFDCVSIHERDEAKMRQFQELRKQLDAIIDAYTSMNGDPLAYLNVIGLSYQLVYLLLKNFQKEKPHNSAMKTTKYLQRLTDITNYIKEHYHQPLSIDTLSKTFHLSPEYLSRFFRKHMGMTIFDYINAIRLGKAYRDLVNTDRPILQIALQHGFANEKSFIRVFKNVYHLTPSQYRKHIQQQRADAMMKIGQD